MIDRRKLVIGAAGLSGGVLLGTGMSAMLLREDSKPSVSLLGSGQSMSVLISSERASIAIVHGSDPVDFGDALRSARVPLMSRTDIAIIPAPAATGETFVRRALAQLGASSVVALDNANTLLDVGVSVDKVLESAATIDLPGGVSVQVDEMQAEHWRAAVRSGMESMVVALGEPVDFSFNVPLTAWVQIDGKLPPQDMMANARPPAIYVPAASMSGNEARQFYQSIGTWAPRIERIHAGDARRLFLT